MKKTAQEPETTIPAFIPCTRQQMELIAAQLDRFQAVQLQMQGAVYQAAVKMGVDLGKYEFNAQQLGFVRKPNGNG